MITQIVKTILEGGTVVIRTDTLYGILALASNQTAVEKVYDIKQRNKTKQCIVLLADAHDAPAHHKEIDEHSTQAQTPTTVVVPSTTEPDWLLRGSATIAYRVTREPLLKEVIRQTGPVIAPSANPESRDPAYTIEEAKAYFGDAIDLYVDGGEVPREIHASKIVELDVSGAEKILRQG